MFSYRYIYCQPASVRLFQASRSDEVVKSLAVRLGAIAAVARETSFMRGMRTGAAAPGGSACARGDVLACVLVRLADID